MEALDEDEQEEELLRMEACLDEQELEEERVEQVHEARATAGGAAVSVSQTTRSSSGLELDENEYGEMYPSEDEQGFVEQWKRRLNSDDGLMASLWSMMLSVTGGVESAAFFKSLGGGHCKQSVCGKVWKRGSIAYRCLVCEVDPTSALCAACFFAGDHKVKLTAPAGGRPHPPLPPPLDPRSLPAPNPPNPGSSYPRATSTESSNRVAAATAVTRPPGARRGSVQSMARPQTRMATPCTSHDSRHRSRAGCAHSSPSCSEGSCATRARRLKAPNGRRLEDAWPLPKCPPPPPTPPPPKLKLHPPTPPTARPL